MDKPELLKRLSFGQRVAEEEAEHLASYFVETDQWRRLFSGEIDVVYGPKGSGKSALYSTVVARATELFDRGILIQPAENPRGTPAFAGLVADPPTSEPEFVFLWKIYLLSLVAKLLLDFELRNEASKYVLDELGAAGLVSAPGSSLQAILKAAMDYVKSIGSVEGEMAADPVTGVPVAIRARITFSEPSPDQAARGAVSVDAMLKHAADAFEAEGLSVWMLLDRLDVAFSESRELEKNALRALFRVYLDLQALDSINLKIFLRTDIWAAITEEGFREGSHVTRQLTISWDRSSLLNLVVQRLVGNDAVIGGFSVEAVDVLASTENQDRLFYRAFPDQVDLGGRRPKTFDWLAGHTKDGHGVTAPRELIHLLTESRNVQLKRLERGEAEPPDEQIIDRQSIREAMPEVSRVRLEQTLYAEYAGLKPFIEALAGEKTLQSVASLVKIWKVEPDEARRAADELVDIGFFEPRGPKAEPTYWVPFMHRSALGMIQGSVEGLDDAGPDD